jgi:hypothetical protein
MIATNGKSSYLKNNEKLVVGEGGGEVFIDINLEDGNELLELVGGDHLDDGDQGLEDEVVVELAVAVLHEDREEGVQHVRQELHHLCCLHLMRADRHKT